MYYVSTIKTLKSNRRMCYICDKRLNDEDTIESLDSKNLRGSLSIKIHKLCKSMLPPINLYK